MRQRTLLSVLNLTPSESSRCACHQPTKKRSVIRTEACEEKAHGLELSAYHFCHDKMCLLRQKHACRDRTFVATKFCFVCRDKSFVATSILLSRRKMCFVTTEMTLVAASANDSLGAGGSSFVSLVSVPSLSLCFFVRSWVLLVFCPDTVTIMISFFSTAASPRPRPPPRGHILL